VSHSEKVFICEYGCGERMIYTDKFKLVSEYKPTGDQPQAIDALVKGVLNGDKEQTLMGVTGSGKTFTMANIIEKINRPTLVLAHNKTLAAQLCSEFKEFFPENAVEYFVSYYDYYQPEAYVPTTDTYIEKGDFKGMERMHILGGFVVKSLPRGIICAVAFYLGTPVMNRVLEAIPVFVQNGLVAAAGFIPALGIALLAQMILSKKTMVYFILGFALAAYLKIPMLGIAMMAGCLAVILVQMQGTQKVAVQEVEDDDF
jgi:hypothetical protein